ncbi:MAG: hypothetical protein JRH11_18145 [Deltaproteobacteria bacterium]|nr:hypothetical protein [Deltaproteobacteria bacterium]
MIAALIILLLSAFGVTPSDEELAAYEQSYYDRVHHVFLELGSEVDDGGIAPTFAIGYEAYVHRGRRGVAVEVVGETIGLPFADDADYFVGFGAGFYPIPKLRIALSYGPLFRGGNVYTRGRADVSGRFQIFSMTVQPYVRLSVNGDDSFGFDFGGRFEY